MIDNSKEAKKILSQAVKNAAKEIGFFLQKEARDRVPVDKGLLKTSIDFQVKETGEDAARVTIGTPLEYSIYVEKGTGIFAEGGKGRPTPWVYKDLRTGEFIRTQGQRPQPFLYPAFRDNKDKIEKFVREAFK